MQIQRMKKTNKKVKMAVGGMTPTPKKMSLRETLAASNARRQSFAAQANSTAKTPVAASVTQANNAAPKPMMAKGGMVKSNCGASMKPTQKGKK